MRYVYMLNRLRYSILLLTIIFTHFTDAAAQGTSKHKAKITGIVTDENHDPIELATVRIEKPVLVGTTTDLRGHYSISVDTQDSVTVIFSMIGYRTKKKTLRRPKGIIALNVTMLPSDVELEGVTVSEVRRQTTQTQKLDIKDRKLMPDASGGSVESYIATQAGVSSNNELSSQYNVRGGSFDENSVYINGIEVYRPMLISSGQQEGLSIINPDMVSDIGFSSGGFEAKYGDKMSSVLDITYKKVKKFEGSANLSMLGGGIYAGFGNKHFSMTQSVRYKTNRYLLGTLDTKGEYNPNFVDYQNYTSWSPNKRWTIDFIGNYSRNSYKFKPSDRTTTFGTLDDIKEFKVYFDGQEKDLFRTYFMTASITRKFTEHTFISLQGAAYNSKEQETYDIQGEYWLNNEGMDESIGVGTYKEHARNYLTTSVKSVTLNGQVRKKAHEIRWGALLKHEVVDEKMKEWEMRDSAGYSLPHSDSQLRLIYNLSSNNELSSNRYELYAQDTWRMNNDKGMFTINYGLRYAYWDFNRESIVSPRLSVGFIPKKNENFTFRFATGLYYQAPFYKELKDTTMAANGNATVTLNSEIKSQRSIHFVLAGDYKFRMANRPFKFTTEIYYKILSNLNPYNVDNLKITYYGKNLSKGYATGIDMKLFGEFVPGSDSWLTLSIMKTEETLFGKKIPRPTDQRMNLSLYFTDYFPGTDKWKMSLKLSYAGGLPFGPPHTGRETQFFRTPAYRRADIGMSYRLLNNEEHDIRTGVASKLRNAWIGIDAFNLLNINNVNSYFWLTDVTNNQYAVPNYLTGRQINVRLLLEF